MAMDQWIIHIGSYCRTGQSSAWDGLEYRLVIGELDP
jgi:hypothetical protein